MLRRLGLVILVAFAAALDAAAQGPDFVFAVTEGVTYQATPKDIRDRFAPLAEVLGRALHRNARVVVVSSYDELRGGLARQEYDVAFVHPAHVAMAEIKAGRYKAVAWTVGFTDYSVSLMTKGDGMKSLADLPGHTLVTPDPDSITAAMVRAMFREQKVGNVKVVTTRYQDAVPFYLQHGFAEVGATAAKSVVKTWTEGGGKVLTQSRPVPIKQVLASSRLSAADQERLRDALVGLAESKGGHAVLATLTYRGFVAPARDVEASTIVWLGL